MAPATGDGVRAHQHRLSGCPSAPARRPAIDGRRKDQFADPAQASTVNTIRLLSAGPLYSLSEDGELEPRLAAEPPEISADGTTVTIPLRTDVRFHDGSRCVPAMASACVASCASAASATSSETASPLLRWLHRGRLRLRLTPGPPPSRVAHLGYLTVWPQAYQEHSDRSR